MDMDMDIDVSSNISESESEKELGESGSEEELSESGSEEKLSESASEEKFSESASESKEKFEESKTLISESKDCHTFQDLGLSSSGFPVMEELRRQGKLCDVTLKVEDQSFSGHRIILAATIPYFQAMFTHDMMESKQKEITMQGIDAIALEALINYAYSGRITINANNVQCLMLGASILQLYKIYDACENFIIRRLTPHTVLGIRQFAYEFGCIGLVDFAEMYLQLYFIEVSRSEEFLRLSCNELLDIIKRDELHVSEVQVFEAVINWVKKDPQIRQLDLPLLLSKVRMPLLPPHFLADRIATEDLIRNNHHCRDLLDEAMDYHLMPERRPLLQSFRTRPRCCNYIVGHIFAVGGLTKCGHSLSTVEVFDPIKKKWQMAKPMSMLRSRVGVAVMKNKLYAFGGYNGAKRLSTVEVFDPIRRVWSEISSMHCERSAVGAAALHDLLYVCGGYDGISSLNTVECYNPDTDKWTMVTSMEKHRSAGGVISFEGYVYCLGGHDGLSIFDSVERFDPNTNCWTLRKPMLSKRCRLGVATLYGKLYVCGGYDGATFLRSVEMYDPISDRWKFVASMNVKRSRVALVANMGKLWAIGGYDGVSNLPTVEVYDPATDSWSFVAAMCAHEGGVGVGVIPHLKENNL